MADETLILEDKVQTTEEITVEENPEVIAEPKLVGIDNTTGTINFNASSEINEATGVDELELLSGDFDPEKDFEEHAAGSMKDVYDLNEVEIMDMLEVIRKVRNGESFSVYNALPTKMQDLIKGSMLANGIPGNVENRNLLAKELIKDIAGDVATENIFIEYDNAMKEILNVPSILDMHAENVQEIMETKTVERAAELREKGYEKQASELEAIANKFKETYTFVRSHNLLDTSERTRNRITKDVSKYARFVEDFNFRFGKSKFIINDINLMTESLKRLCNLHQKDYTEEQCEAFTILFCKVCDKTIDVNSPSDNAFVYYSIKNIISLDFVTNENTMVKFNKDLIENIFTLLDRIVSIDKTNKGE